MEREAGPLGRRSTLRLCYLPGAELDFVRPGKGPELTPGAGRHPSVCVDSFSQHRVGDVLAFRTFANSTFSPNGRENLCTSFMMCTSVYRFCVCVQVM